MFELISLDFQNLNYLYIFNGWNDKSSALSSFLQSDRFFTNDIWRSDLAFFDLTYLLCIADSIPRPHTAICIPTKMDKIEDEWRIQRYIFKILLYTGLPRVGPLMARR